MATAPAEVTPAPRGIFISKSEAQRQGLTRAALARAIADGTVAVRRIPGSFAKVRLADVLALLDGASESS
jgi:hypothetical protein